MPLPEVLVLILAGGAGNRLELLTATRAKPAVPFAGTHRLIDFPLSNCHNSRIDDVWISQQFNPVSLSDHVSNGRPWDLDRTFGDHWNGGFQEFGLPILLGIRRAPGITGWNRLLSARLSHTFFHDLPVTAYIAARPVLYSAVNSTRPSR